MQVENFYYNPETFYLALFIKFDSCPIRFQNEDIFILV